MSLADNLRQQEEMGGRLKARLEELMREYALYMRELGVEPYPIIEPTGQATGEGDEVRYAYYQCRVVGNAWAVCVPTLKGAHGIPSMPYYMAVDTHDVLWLNLAMANASLRSDGMLWSTRDVVGPTTSILPNEPGVALMLYDHYKWPATEEVFLAALAERAHLEGIDAVVGPVEQALLMAYNQLRRVK